MRKRKLWYVPPMASGILLYADRAESAASKARKIMAANAALATEIQITAASFTAKRLSRTRTRAT